MKLTKKIIWLTPVIGAPILLPYCVTSCNKQNPEQPFNIEAVWIYNDQTNVAALQYLYPMPEQTDISIPEHITHNGKKYVVNEVLASILTAKCSLVQKLHIPKTVSIYSALDVSSAPNLREITVDPKNPYFTSRDENGQECNCIINKNLEVVNGIGAFRIPNNATKILNRAFFGNRLIKNITIPESVIEIEEFAFSWSVFETVNVPGTVKTIGRGCFQNCLYLKNITLNEGITNIGAEVFMDCRNLTALKIPNSIVVPPHSVSSMDFLCQNCKSLASVSLSPNMATIPTGIFLGCPKLTQIQIPENVVTIKTNAFSGTGISTITIPKRVEEMKYGVFDNCPNLTEFIVDSQNTKLTTDADRQTIYTKEDGDLIAIIPKEELHVPEGIKIIGPQVLENNKTVKQLWLPNSLTTLGHYAFASSSISVFHIGSGLENLDKNAFYATDNRSQIFVDSANQHFTSQNDSGGECNCLMDINRSIVYLGAPTSIIPNSVTTIKPFAFAFLDIESFDEIQGFNNVQKLEDWSIYGCGEIQEFTLSSKLNFIGDDNFSFWYKLQKITVEQDFTTWPVEFSDNVATMAVPSTGTFVIQNLNQENLIKQHWAFSANWTFEVSQ